MVKGLNSLSELLPSNVSVLEAEDSDGIIIRVATNTDEGTLMQRNYISYDLIKNLSIEHFVGIVLSSVDLITDNLIHVAHTIHGQGD